MSSSLHSPSAPEETMDEQRLFLRRKVPLPVPIELLPGKEMWLHDIGEGGLSVSGSSRLEPGTATYFSFQFPDSNSIIEATGVVAWCDGAGRVGIRFTRIKPDSTAVLKRWLKSDEKAAASMPASAEYPHLGVQPPRAHGHVTELRAAVRATVPDSGRALGIIVEYMLRLTRASGAAIAWREDGKVVCRASVGNAPPPGAPLNLDSSATGESYRTGNIVSITDTETDLRVDAALCRQLEFRSLLIVPIAVHEEVIGIAEVFSPLPGNFEGGDILLLGSVAELAAEVYGWAHPPTNRDIPVAEQLQASERLPCASDETTGAANKNQDAEEKTDSAWKPRSYLLLMVLLSVTAAGFGYLLDLHLTAKFMRARESRLARQNVLAVPELKSGAAGSNPVIPASMSPTAEPEAARRTALSKSASRVPLRARPNLHANFTRSSEIDTRIDVPTPGAPAMTASGKLVSLPAGVYAPAVGPAVNGSAEHGGATQLTPARLLHRVEPVFPDFARSAGMEGTILMSATIGKDGRLKDVKLVSGNRALATEAFRALREWRYRPYLMNGHPIEAETRIIMDFHP